MSHKARNVSLKARLGCREAGDEKMRLVSQSEQWGNSIITNTLPFINHRQWAQREHPIVASYCVQHKIFLPRKTSFNMINVRMTKWRRLAWVAQGNNKSWLTPMTEGRIEDEKEGETHLAGGLRECLWCRDPSRSKCSECPGMRCHQPLLDTGQMPVSTLSQWRDWGSSSCL